MSILITVLLVIIISGLSYHLGKLEGIKASNRNVAKLLREYNKQKEQ